jgi:hypothetical protein
VLLSAAASSLLVACPDALALLQLHPAQQAKMDINTGSNMDIFSSQIHTETLAASVAGSLAAKESPAAEVAVAVRALWHSPNRACMHCQHPTQQLECTVYYCFIQLLAA